MKWDDIVHFYSTHESINEMKLCIFTVDKKCLAQKWQARVQTVHFYNILKLEFLIKTLSIQKDFLATVLSRINLTWTFARETCPAWDLGFRIRCSWQRGRSWTIKKIITCKLFGWKLIGSMRSFIKRKSHHGVNILNPISFQLYS